MTYANADERAAFIKGLRALADYLESSPDVPTPGFTTTVHVFPPDGPCAEMRAEIDVIAQRLGTTARLAAEGRHYLATRAFGPVEYRAVAICKTCHHDQDEVTR